MLFNKLSKYNSYCETEHYPYKVRHEIYYFIPYKDELLIRTGIDKLQLAYNINDELFFKSFDKYFMDKSKSCKGCYVTISPSSNLTEYNMSFWLVGSDEVFKAASKYYKSVGDSYIGEIDVTEDDIDDYLVRKHIEKYNL